MAPRLQPLLLRLLQHLAQRKPGRFRPPPLHPAQLLEQLHAQKLFSISGLERRSSVAGIILASAVASLPQSERSTHVVKSSLIALIGALVVVSAFAASPNSGTLSSANPVLNWTGGGPYIVPAPSNANDAICTVPMQCDVFTLTGDFPANYLSTNCHDSIHISVGWVDASGTADFDVYVYDSAGNLISGSSAATSSNPE